MHIYKHINNYVFDAHADVNKKNAHFCKYPILTSCGLLIYNSETFSICI